jgi:4-hydroxy-3-polyprenylbenzoate decarboxylase
VGRPPQEDTAFGALIHEISGSAIPNEIPGVKEVHAVDAAGVHPLLLAVGSERYTPYLKSRRPAELLTQANRILGTGQLSLAKYLFIGADDQGTLHCHDIKAFFEFMFERVDLGRDLHFYTKTTIDTLDYSGGDINEGSKLVIAACGDKKRDLAKHLPACISECNFITGPVMLMNGVMGLMLSPFTNAEAAKAEISRLSQWISDRKNDFAGMVQVVIYDDFKFAPDPKDLNDYVWVTYTRSNPSHDIYGVDEFTEHKHWGCQGPMIIDARKKPHHAPELKADPEVQKRIERFFEKGGPLEKWA